ncbi:MAG: LytTR family DNA-binding domain-containing protein [Bacteroidota bacterium]
MSFLSKPFPINADLTSDLKIIVLAILFPPLFIAFVQPLGVVSGFEPSFYGWLAIGGFGLISGIVTSIFGVLLPTLFDRFFEGLKIAGAILYYLSFFIVIASANYFYKTYFEGVFAFTWTEYFNVVKYTFLIGIFPLTLSIFWIYQKRLSKNLKLAESINNSIREAKNNSNLIIQGEGENEVLRITTDAFLFAESADNYVTIYFLHNHSVSKRLLRISLKSLETQFAELPYLVRTHRSFVVNIFNVTQAKGNSRGLTLTLKYTDRCVAVSRKHISLVTRLMKS